VGVLIALFLESLLHQYYYYIPRPSQHLDPPFQTGCREPETDGPREKAAIIMLAQNSDLDGARKSMQSFEDHFNRWFHYPVIFMNDEPWSEEFKNAMTAIVSGEAKFEVLPLGMFGFPKHTDLEEAKKNMAFQEETKIHKGGLESYHHMCRFYSG
jgi:mannosyltransferase